MEFCKCCKKSIQPSDMVVVWHNKIYFDAPCLILDISRKYEVDWEKVWSSCEFIGLERLYGRLCI